MLIEILTYIAMVAAIGGGLIMAGKNHTLAVKWFEFGNAVTLAVGLGTGNIALILTVLGFMAINTKIYHDPEYRLFLVLIFCYLLSLLGVSMEVFMRMDWIGLIATASALRGAWCVVLGRFREMSYQWIFADSLFTYVGIRDGLPGFTIQSIIFVICGIFRLYGIDPFEVVRRWWGNLLILINKTREIPTTEENNRE